MLRVPPGKVRHLRGTFLPPEAEAHKPGALELARALVEGLPVPNRDVIREETSTAFHVQTQE